jgi:ABC-2 type transport system ATP-binding protein
VRHVIAERRAAGACVLLTTHELPEAERLADEVVIVAHGRAAARGSVADLRRGESAIRFAAPSGIDVADLAGALGLEVALVREVEPGEYAVAAEPSAARVAAVAGFLEGRGLPLTDLRAGHGSLEDVYLAVTRQASAERAALDSERSAV